MGWASQEAYFDSLPAESRLRLEQIRDALEARIPDCTRCISYQMPAFRLKHTFFFMGAFRHHIGIYPPLRDDDALVAETMRFRGPKGNLSFPHDEPLPLDLIGRIAESLARTVGR